MRSLLGLVLVSLLFVAFAHNVHAEIEPREGLDADLKDEKIPLKTDDDVAEREEESISRLEGYSEDEIKLIEARRQNFAFQAEVSKVMDILIGALYSNRDIFLRELISNASDALDKIRYKSLTDPSSLGDVKDLEIRIKADKENKTIIIQDTGVGMTKEELIKNLGTIAQSGTKEFSKAIIEGAANNLIGQFGVGFYSAFLVADRVTVQTKSNDDPVQHIWESHAAAGFTIAEDPKGNTLGRGTRITLHMKDSDEVFLSSQALEELIKKYSEFINFPIFLWKDKTIEVEEEVEEEDIDEEEEEEDVELKDEEDEEKKDEDEEGTEKKKKTKKVEKTVWEWERLNTTRPIWMRNASDVTEEEYESFFKAISKDSGKPLSYQHFSAEGDVEFRAILFLPEKPPLGQFDGNVKQRGVKLYVKRVFITDDFDTVIPKYLAFLQGVVDSDDLPLNVSREVLQQSKLLDLIKRKVVRKAVAMFQQLAEEEEKFKTFYKAYGTNIKLGVIEDQQNRNRLAKLLRFSSSKTGELTSFDDYVSRMKEGQDQIYFLSGEDVNSLKTSPLVERLLKQDYEVLFMVDPIDEYAMQHLNKYEKHKITNLGHEGAKLPEDTENEANKEEQSEELKPLIDFLQSELSSRIGRVKISDRLVNSPCTIVAESWGYTATMERVVKAQALADAGAHRTWVGKKVLEINPTHPLITELNQLVKNGPGSQVAKDTARLLLDTAALGSGYTIEEPSQFATRIHRIIASSLEVELPEPAAPEPVKAGKDEL